MKRNRSPIPNKLPPTGWREIGCARWGGENTRCSIPALSGSLVILMALATLLSACQVKENSPTYPDLGTVSTPSKTSYPLEKRRQIVRDLIDDRNLARHRKEVIRHRSGLSDVPPPPAPVPTKTRAEDIIPGAPIDERDVAEKDSGDQPDGVYRDRTQFDDGTLDDFIRRLKRDTAPVIGGTPAVDQKPTDGEQGTDQPSEDPKPQSWRFQREFGTNHAASFSDLDRPLVLTAFASLAEPKNEAVAVRLAAAEDDRSFMCKYLGWAVAWSDACLIEGEKTSSEDETVAAADNDKVEDRATSAESEDLPADKEELEKGDDDAAVQIQDDADDETSLSEDIGDGDLLPMTGTLDRLRNLIRSRNRRSEETSTERKSLSYEAEEFKPPADKGPPVPASRPEVEKDLRIVRNDHVFEFDRTPRPAFKPLPPESKIVILPPEKPRHERKTEFVPASRPSAPAVDQEVVIDDARTVQQDALANLPAPEDKGTGDLAARDLDHAKIGPLQGDPSPLTVDPAEPDGSLLLDSELILFDSGSTKLPVGIERRLKAMLDDARERDGKLFIISEASIGNLAMERARGVGLALVRMGATADLIEYDIVIVRSADHVQILLKEAGERDGDAPVAGEIDKIK